MKKYIAILLAMALVVGTAITIQSAGGSTVKRADDPVKVQGKALKSFVGQPIDKMRLSVYKAGAFAPAPYQIDERNAANEWVFTIGEEKAVDADGGKLDDNDELVFMAFDLGEAAPAGSKPQGAKSCADIAVTDPVDSGSGHAYLCIYDAPPAPSKADYASYSIEGPWMWMIGQTYKIGTGVNESYFDKIMFKASGGAWSVDVADRYKTRARGLPIPGKKMVPESDAKAKAVAWVDGPVRVIRKSKGYLQVVGGIKIHGEGSSQNLYYPSFFEIPLVIKIPDLPKALLKSFNMSVTVDFNQQMYGSKYYDTVNKAGVMIDGVMSDAEKNLDRKTNHRWWMITGPKGTVMARYVLTPEMDKFVTTPAYYVDDKAALDAPDEEPGQSNIGLVMENFSQLTPGTTYRYTAFFHMPSNFKWGEQARVLNFLDKPLQVKITEF